MPQADAPYGNYKGYYTKRGNQSSEPRLQALPPGLFKGKRVLDIGCNEGWVTSSRYKAQEVIGVDIDTELDSVQNRLSQHPGGTLRQANIILYWLVSEIDTSTTDQAENEVYFPACFPSLFGPVPIPPEHSAFPNNVSFHRSDWVNQGCEADLPGYNVVIAFSVSKWIHVHGGDEGIKQFFSRVRDVLATRTTDKSPGIFVLEAQPWSGYHNAMRKANLHRPKDQKPLESLKLDPSEFSGVLSELGFSKPQRAGIIGEGGFQRPIDIYEWRCG